MAPLLSRNRSTLRKVVVVTQVLLVGLGFALYFGRSDSATHQISYNNYIHFPPFSGDISPIQGSEDDWNDETSLDMTRLSHAMIPAVEQDNLWTNDNNRMLTNLFQCMEMGTCAPNQKKIIILGSYHFLGALVGWNGGEDMWCRSTVLALKERNYTILYALNNDRAVQLYQMFPKMVKAVLLEVPEVYNCHADTENCVLSDRNPHGIPIWKIFSWHFWVHTAHPLGRLWTLNPEPYELEGHENPNTYVGYSVEPSCLSTPYVPPAQRRDQGYVMAKRLHYFTPIPERAWSNDYYEDAVVASGIELVLGANLLDGGEASRIELPKGIRNLGVLPQPKFLEEVAHSKVMIGVGQPWTSPTPYEALCLGVPFINPILSWDENNKTNRMAWSTQHGLLRHLNPPYVYNVHRDDHDGFVAAVKAAVENPIERHILDRMRIPVIAERIQTLFDRDWEAEYTKLSDEGDL